MAVTTVNQKLALLGERLPVSADGIGVDDIWQLLGEYPRDAIVIVFGTASKFPYGAIL